MRIPMRKLTFCVLACMLFFTAYSCKEQGGHPSAEGETIIFSGKKKSIVDTAFFARSSLIPLETTDDALIRKIDAICIANDTLFILDRSLKKIFIYDKKGKFIHVIQDIGNGPHEYASITDICVDKDLLVVLCDIPYKIMKYNFRGQFVEEESLPNYFSNIAVINDRVYLYENGGLGRQKLGIYNEQDQNLKEIPFPKGRYIKAEQEGVGYSFGSGRLLTASRNVLFTCPLNYTIYTVEQDMPKAKYTIDFGEREIPQTLLEQNISPKDFLDMIDREKYIHSMGNVVENDSYLMFQTNPSVFLLDKQTKELTECFMITNGVLGGGHTGYLAVNGLPMIAQVHRASMFKKNIDNLIKYNILPKGKFTDEYLRVYENLDEEDNPILCLYELPHK